MFFLVPVTTSVVTALAVPPVEVSVASAVFSAPSVLPVVDAIATTVAFVPPAPSLESPDAAVATTVSLVRVSSPVPQEDSNVPLSLFFSGPTISGSIHPRLGEDVCPPPEEMGRNSQKAVAEKETGGTSNTSSCFSRFLPNITETFS